MMYAKEYWKPVPVERFADRYEISSYGRVRNAETGNLLRTSIARIIAWILMGPVFLLFTWIAIGGMIADYQIKKKRREEYLRSQEEWLRTHVRGYKGGKK